MMNAHVMSPDEFFRLVGLQLGKYRPKEIVDLKVEIEGETRALEVNAQVTGVVDEERVRKIVQMKLRLDGLYMDWVEGKIS